MALNTGTEWELVAAQIAKETDPERLRELAAKFNRVLDEREKLRRQQELDMRQATVRARSLRRAGAEDTEDELGTGIPC